MVSRYYQTHDWQLLQAHFDLVGDAQEISPQYNISPWQLTPVVRQRDRRRQLSMLRWGFTASFAGPDQAAQYSLINAHAERVAIAPVFSRAFGRQQCLVVAEGWYRWQIADTGERHPHRITPADGGPLAFAGLWDSWFDGEKQVETFAIVTATANTLLRQFGKRMPVIIKPGDYDTWLGGDGGEEILKPCPDDLLRADRVGDTVNDATNDTPACIEPVRKRLEK